MTGAPRIYLVAGPASAGKTTAARALAARLDRSVHVAVDDLRHMVVGGLALPAPGWAPELRRQVELARSTAVHIADAYTDAGFTVVIDDFFDPLGMREYEGLLGRPGVRAVLLVPDPAEGRRRNAARAAGPDPTADLAIAHAAAFLPPRIPGLAAGGWLVLDTTTMDVAATVDAILAERPAPTTAPGTRRAPYPPRVPAPDPRATPYLDEAYVAAVVADPDPLRRNARITRGYHALSEAVAAILGREHANWLTFGQWASAEARESIDGRDVPDAVRPFMGEAIARAVADGNAAIFGDVAPPFIRFVQAAGSATPGEDAAAAARSAVLALPRVAASEDLRRAFGAYADALALRLAGDPDPRRRAARMLVANASVGAHEQRVADPYVRAAIPGRWISAVVATSHMGLRLPAGVLELARDVPPPAYLGGPAFPAALAALEDEEALALVARFGLDADSAARSGAPDWESYEERMGFIVTLLRAYQCDPALFALPPGTPED